MLIKFANHLDMTLDKNNGLQISHISKKEINKGESIQAKDLRSGIFKRILADYPDFNKDQYISMDELNSYRRLVQTSIIKQGKGEIASLHKVVIDAIKNNGIIADNIQEDIEPSLTLGQRLADKIAVFGGSWTFIIAFFTFILIWIITNIWLLTTSPFDPFPFILLNLILSCLASIQAPIIMMSQNRQEQKDRLRGEHDYKVNLKAELEIRILSEKIDHLLIHQNKKLLEIQEIQNDYLEDLLVEIRKK